MACPVYCLVQHPEQLDPLITRLKNAGVKNEDIAIIPRRHWPLPAAGLPSESVLEDLLVPYLWSLSLTPAALWWQWTLSGEANFLLKRAGGHAVIPLEIYESKLQQKKNRR